MTWFINKQKDEGLRPKHLKDDGDPTRHQMIKLYEAYEDACRRNGVVDFAELLLRSYEILRDARASASTTARVSGTCSSTNSRTPTPSSTSG